MRLVGRELTLPLELAIHTAYTWHFLFDWIAQCQYIVETMSTRLLREDIDGDGKGDTLSRLRSSESVHHVSRRGNGQERVTAAREKLNPDHVSLSFNL